MPPFSDVPLSPVSFLARAGSVYGTSLAVIDGERRFSYAEFAARSLALTGLLAEFGVEPGDRVGALCANSHVLLEMHNGVPWRGAVLVPLNTRLSRPELAWILDHAGAKVLVATAEFAALAADVAGDVGIPLVVEGDGPADYEALLARAEPAPRPVSDELTLLAINYTSGTTGKPKGVMYSHRGAYLQAMAMAFHMGFTTRSRYLWTLPMFHCDGWCFTWAVTAAGAVHCCQRTFDAARTWAMLTEHHITHFSGAPTVLTMISASPAAQAERPGGTIRVQTGGSPPSPTLLAAMARLNIDVTHLYGLTETYGPVVINDWNSAWDALPLPDQARLRARQGVGNVVSGPVRVVHPDGSDVAADGEEIGEIVIRGNNVMLGYYRDPEATEAASIGGWMRTGDLAFMYPDGYIEIRDRSKDLIIAGGENIASVEVERAIESHPGVLEAAVVAMPDEKWGELPAAFVTLRDGAAVSEDDIVTHVRAQLAGFKTPRRIVFTELPKTSTGKIRKNELRERAAALAAAPAPGDLSHGVSS